MSSPPVEWITDDQADFLDGHHHGYGVSTHDGHGRWTSTTTTTHATMTTTTMTRHIFLHFGQYHFLGALDTALGTGDGDLSVAVDHLVLWTGWGGVGWVSEMSEVSEVSEAINQPTTTTMRKSQQ